MKSKKVVCVFAVLFITVLSTVNLYINGRNNEIKIDTALEILDVNAAANSEHGRPLLYNSTLGYKCENCSGTDCGAVCNLNYE
jgi:hypothetical protein